MMHTLAMLAGVCVCGALRVGPVSGPGRPVGAPCTASVPAMVPLQPSAARLSAPRMQEPAVDFYDEYVETDPVTGEQKTLALDEKEKLYLECLDAYYNEGGKQLLGNEEYEQLKLDLDFEGSVIATYSKDEIRFVLSVKRFKMGKPTLSDTEYDALREKLKKEGSLVVLHDAASCSVDGQCKTDMRVDVGKNRLLYLPGTAGGLLLVMEAIYWTVGLDPLISAVLGAVPAYFFGAWFTNTVFAQKPLVVQATCPECTYLFPVFFGDLFSVQTDAIVPGGTPGTDLEVKCPQMSCKADLIANRDTMVIITKNPVKSQVKA